VFDLATAGVQHWLTDALAHPWATFFQFTPGMLSIVSTWLYGNRSLSGPVVGVVSQVCWLGFIVIYGMWLMLPMFGFFWRCTCATSRSGWPFAERDLMATRRRPSGQRKETKVKVDKAFADSGKVKLGNLVRPF
jgi:hypothetical protein